MPSRLLERDTLEAMLLDQGPGQLSFRVVRAQEASSS